MATRPNLINFELNPEEQESFYAALRVANEKRNAPLTKNPFAKELVLKAIQRFKP